MGTFRHAGVGLAGGTGSLYHLIQTYHKDAGVVSTPLHFDLSVHKLQVPTFDPRKENKQVMRRSYIPVVPFRPSPWQPFERRRAR